MRKTFLLVLLLIMSSAYAQEQKKVNFDEQFKKENQGKTKVEIHEVKELLHIMIAITEVGLENDDMVQQSGTYYQDVLKQFKTFKNEKIIGKFDSLIKANAVNYVLITGNGMSYDFKGNKLVPDKNYIFPAQSVSSHTTVKTNIIKTWKSDIENFAEKSGFRAFYKKHIPYYKTLISQYNTTANLDEQWKWLEKNFDTRVNNYTVLTSPLINSLNYTTSYHDNGFLQILMVLPPLDEPQGRTEKENTVYNTRVMFTEVDHNYTGAPLKKYTELINESLKEREKWVNVKQEGIEYYPNPIRVFDEYMTFAVFYLYCADKYADDSPTVAYAYRDVNEIMKQRGFIKMKEFNDELLSLRKKYPTKKIEDLYPDLLQWCKMQ
ncbi:DUF4932 domain-containing protein [Chryseobacterium sp. JK1]|uniref:DUF4932 domain-containing protein n=1 Tax=Chryseobacterium sp. JK1 TaxID=874294 RepID=UPI003D683430